MNKDVFLKALADLMIIWAAVFVSVSVFYASQLIGANDEAATPDNIEYIGTRLIDVIFKVGIVFSFIFSASFLFNGLYVDKSQGLASKLLLYAKSVFIATVVLVAFLIFTNIMLFLDIFENYRQNSTLFEDNSMFKTIVITWFISVTTMLLARIWIYTYATSKLVRNRNTLSDTSRNILLIGGAGYIGTALIGRLLENNYRVRVLDILLFGSEPISEFKGDPNFKFIQADFRKVDDLVIAMQDCSTVVHLGGIVGDPASSIDEYLTVEVNLTSTKIVAQIAKAAGVKRLIFASSCSVYGAQTGIMDELSNPKPLSLYAKTKIASEKVLEEMHSEDFSTVILRFSTIYGISGRTRFDLVLNLLTAKGCVDRKITVFGPSQTRPFLHVSDAANAILSVLDAPLDKVRNEIFNVGSSAENFTLLEIAEKIKRKIPQAEIVISKEDEDARNYNVSFEKISNVLGYVPSWTVDDGIDQVISLFESGRIENYKDAIYNNYQHMSEDGRGVLTGNLYSGWESELLKEHGDESNK